MFGRKDLTHLSRNAIMLQYLFHFTHHEFLKFSFHSQNLKGGLWTGQHFSNNCISSMEPLMLNNHWKPWINWRVSLTVVDEYIQYVLQLSQDAANMIYRRIISIPRY